MAFNKNSIFEDTCLEFPCTGFWIVHILGAAFIFFLGMRFALRRAPLPLVALMKLLSRV